MPAQKPKRERAPKPMAMDDIAMRFLNTPPQPREKKAKGKATKPAK